VHEIFRRNRRLWFPVGLVIGVVIGGLMPHTPLHAVATDTSDSFAIATGPVDSDVEAIYFLDFLTGDLRAAVLGSQNGRFTAFYNYNVLNDLGVDPSKKPRYLMVTGIADLRRAGGTQVRPSRAVVYVAEVTTGKVAAYAIPWSQASHARNKLIRQPLIPLDVAPFRTATIRRGAVTDEGGVDVDRDRRQRR